ncbi:MAG: HPr family phosphocarrier protein [Lentisphaeria bacterium]
MITINCKVRNQAGLHARPSSKIVAVTKKYPDTRILIEKDGETISAASMMNLMLLAASMGTELQIHLDGASEELAANDLKELFDSKFDEV